MHETNDDQKRRPRDLVRDACTRKPTTKGLIREEICGMQAADMRCTPNNKNKLVSSLYAI